MKYFVFAFILLILISFFSISSAQAGSASIDMPVGVTILQCGPGNMLEQSCKEDSRCCPLFRKEKQILKLSKNTLQTRYRTPSEFSPQK